MWIWRHGLNTNQKMQSWTFNGHMNIETWVLRCRVSVPFWVSLKKQWQSKWTLKVKLLHLPGLTFRLFPRCDVWTDTMATQEPSPPSSMESNKPGFPKKILGNKLEDKHLCNCCHNILRRPFQAQCGHRFCSYCFNRTVRWGVEWPKAKISALEVKYLDFKKKKKL